MKRTRLLGVAPRQRAVIDGPFDHRLVAHQGDVPVFRLGIVVGGGVPAAIARDGHLHVVRVGQAEPRVEAVAHRQELGELSQVPLADDAGGVAARLQQLGERDLLGRQSRRRIGAEDAGRFRAVAAEHAVAHRQPAGEQRGPAGRAHRLDVERRPLLALCGHAIEPRRADGGRAEGAEVAVAEVVGEDDDEVGRRGACGLVGARPDRGGGCGSQRRRRGRAAGERAAWCGASYLDRRVDEDVGVNQRRARRARP